MKAFSLYLTLFFSLILSFQAVFAQKVLTQGEYYFNAEPGIGNGVSFGFSSVSEIEENIAISVGNLEPGFHQLYVRLKDSEGRWGIVQNRLFYLQSIENIQPNQLQTLEFYINSDPGVGNGNDLSLAGNGDFIGEISTAGLESGFHFLYVRYQDTQGNWGIAQRRMFYLEAPAEQSNSELTKLEYFFNEDPGVGNGISLNLNHEKEFIGAIETAGLDAGFHKLYVRYQDTRGNWGISQNRLFYLEEARPTNPILIKKIEYYFDEEDPGFGLANPIELTEELPQIDLEALIAVAELEVGEHLLNLRIQDTNGAWSFVETRPFTIENTQDLTPPIPDLDPLPTLTFECIVNFDDLVIPTATDDVDGLIQGTLDDSIFPLTDQSTYTITWTYQDTAGNSSTQDQVIVLDDTIAPHPDLAELPTVSGSCGVTLTAPTSIDNCVGMVTGSTTDPIEFTNPGSYTVTWTFDDGNGNQSVQTQQVEISEGRIIPTLENLPALEGECELIVPVPTAVLECSGELIQGTTSDPLTYTLNGNYLVNWTFEDGNGNSIQQTQQVTIFDGFVPVPDIPQLPNLLGECVVEAFPPTATDNCDGTIIGVAATSTRFTSPGTYDVVWVFTDKNGNFTTQTQLATVQDTQAPVPDIPELPTIEATCFIEIGRPTATDACMGTIEGQADRALTFTETGDYTVTWTYDDGNGNTSSQTQRVIFQADEGPFWITEEGALDQTLTCPTEEEIQEALFAQAPQPGSLCFPIFVQLDGQPVFEPTDDLGNGVYLVNWFARDPIGVRIDYTVRITVVQGGAPVPVLDELQILAGECTISVEDFPKAISSCTGEEILGVTTDPLNYDEQGTFIITWTYDDGDGKITTQNQTVKVLDSSIPLITTNGDQQVNNDPGQCSAIVPVIGEVIDNCGIIEPTGVRSDGLGLTDPYPVGITTITWNAIDQNGNQAEEVIQTIRVIDQDPPTLILEEFVQVETDPGLCSAIVQLEVTGFDNCGIREPFGVRRDGQPLSAPFPVGTTEIQWYLEDVNENPFPLIRRQFVTVQDKIAPIPTIAALPRIVGNAPFTLPVPTATDNCQEFINGISSFGPVLSEPGVFEVIWTFEDVSGNRITQTQEVEVIQSVPLEWAIPPGWLDREVFCGQSFELVEALELRPNLVAGNEQIVPVKESLNVEFDEVSRSNIYTSVWVAENSQSRIEYIQTVSVLPVAIDASDSGIPLPLGSIPTLTARLSEPLINYPVEFYVNDIMVTGPISNNSNGVVSIVANLPIFQEIGVYKIRVVAGRGCSESIAYLPIYDPNSNYITGSGTILSPPGALIADPSVTGDASFGFSSKYKKGSNQVGGKTDFKFTAGEIDFRSTLHESGSLVVSGRKGTYRGEGELNKVPGYRFTVVGFDGGWNGGTDPDRFRIKIWGPNGVVYDNGLGADENADDATVLQKGKILIKEVKTKGNKRILSDLITVDWNTPIETIQKELDQQSADWFDGRQIPLILDESGYDPLTPGLHILNANFDENDWFELEGAAQIQVLVKEKPFATDILAINSQFGKELRAGEKVAELLTLDPVDQIHTYELLVNEFLELRENQLIWKGGPVPAILKFQVSSTDRAGQTISKEITLTKELKMGEFLIFPNPAEDQTQILVELDQPAQVSLRVFDATGKMVISDQFVREETFIQTLDLMGIAPGMYTIQVQTGKVVMTGRLIKK